MGKKKPCGIENVIQDQKYIYKSPSLALRVAMYTNIVIVTGDSGTGKTLAASDIKRAKELGKQNEVKTNCDLSNTVVLLDEDDYAKFRCDEHGKLIIMDKADKYVTAEIAEFIKSSDNLFIIVSRAHNKYLGKLKVRLESLVEFSGKLVNGIVVIDGRTAI